MSADERLKNKTQDIRGFVFIESPNPAKNSRYAIVTDFAPGAVKTRSIPGLATPQDVQKWVDANLKTAQFQGVEVKQLSMFGTGENLQPLYWVGQKSYASNEEAQAHIAESQTVVESQGGNFSEMVSQAQTAYAVPEQPEAIEIKKTPAQFQKEEELALRFLDQLDIGNEMFGPVTGEPSGEKIVWQSFSESSWRKTNLEEKNWNNVVGYWTNRLVLKGIRAPLNTIDPFVEVNPAVDSSGVDFKSNMILSAGLEWRPFARNPFFNNTRIWTMPLLDFVKSYRFVVQYNQRYNLKEEITGSHGHDVKGGLTIFYEWNIDLPPPNEAPPASVPDYIRKYVWGEYYGDYSVYKTGFSTEDDFNAWIFNSSVILGVRLPGIPVPENRLFDSIELMPYMRFEHVNNSDWSFPYQNHYFVAAGVRWMPFRNYRFKDSEWLAKMKLFGEYVGIGRVGYWKQDGDPSGNVDYDLRFGVNISSKRY